MTSFLARARRHRGAYADSLGRLERFFRGPRREPHERGDDAGPAGLVAGTEARSVVAVEVLVEEYVGAPQRIFLEHLNPAVDGTPAAGVPEKNAAQPPCELLCDLIEGHLLARSRRALDREVVAVVPVVLVQRANDQSVDRHPDRTSPVRVAAEHPRVRFGGQIRDAMVL